MAKCIGCGKGVGCGCQLSNGLCIDCLNKKAQTKINETVAPKVVNTTNNFINIEFKEAVNELLHKNSAS